jgi:hypothetical protein
MRGVFVVGAILAGCGAFSDAPDAPGAAADGGAPDASIANDASQTDAPRPEDGDGSGGRQTKILVANASRPLAVAATDQFIVWGSDDGDVWRLGIDGSNHAAISGTYKGSPRQVAIVDDEDVVWCDHTAPKRGLWGWNPTDQTKQITGGISITGFARFGMTVATIDNTSNVVTILDSTGQPSATQFGGYTTLYAITNVGDDVWWTDAGAGTIVRLAAGAGEQPKAVVVAESDPRAIAADDDSMYWTTSTTTIRRFQPAIGTRDIVTGETNVHGLAADATGVYWLTNDSLRRWTKATGTIETLASGFVTPIDTDSNLARLHKIALTPSHIVWLTASDLRLLDK